MKRRSFITGAIALVLVFCMAMPAFAAIKKRADITPIDPTDPKPSIGRSVGGRLKNVKPLPITIIDNNDGPIEIPVPDPQPGIPNLPI